MAELMYITFLKRLSRQRVLLHIFFWMAVLVFFNFVFRWENTRLEVLVISLGFLPGHLIFVYSLNYFLFPRYVLKGKIVASIIGLFGILVIALFYLRVADVYILHYSGRDVLWFPPNFPRATSALFSVGWIGVTIKLVKQWYQEKQKQQQLEKEKLTVELQLLRSQLHPHFLFNTLNSIYSFSLEKSPAAPEMVLKLSSLLRYILYECNAPVIPLAMEIDIIRDYLQLEGMRYGSRLETSLQFTGDWKDKTIAPLLLLPFVENAVKHGISNQPGMGWISLHIHVAGDMLQLKLINGRDNQELAESAGGGLGLRNVRKRLELLYPGRHELKCIKDEDDYQVNLTIQPMYETEVSYS
jgi:sensor histidine kinase YesM